MWVLMDVRRLELLSVRVGSQRSDTGGERCGSFFFFIDWNRDCLFLWSPRALHPDWWWGLNFEYWKFCTKLFSFLAFEALFAKISGSWQGASDKKGIRVRFYSIWFA